MMVFMGFLNVVLCSFLESSAYAEQKIAVFEFQGQGIEQTYLTKLTEQTQNAVVKILPPNEYFIITKENLYQVLQAKNAEYPLFSSLNDVEIGKVIGADRLIIGDIVQIDQTYILTMKLYDTNTGALLATQNVQATTMLELYNANLVASKHLITHGFGYNDNPGFSDVSASIVYIDTPTAIPDLSGLERLMWETEQQRIIEEQISQIRERYLQEWMQKSNETWKSIQPYLQTPRADEFVYEFLENFGNIEVVVQYMDPVTQESKDTIIPILTPEVIEARRLVMPLGYTETKILKGSYVKGCSATNVSQCDADELPKHTVQIKHDIYVMKAEVSQSLFMDVMGYNPSAFVNCGGRCPVNQVSYYDAVQFAVALSLREGLAPCYDAKGKPIHTDYIDVCTGWRIPTDDEWEFIAHSNTKGKATVNAWYKNNSNNTIHATCSVQSSDQICDIIGNVSEWTIAAEGVFFARGGNWDSPPSILRISYKANANESTRSDLLGFRLIRTSF